MLLLTITQLFSYRSTCTMLTVALYFELILSLYYCTVHSRVPKIPKKLSIRVKRSHAVGNLK